MGKPRIYRDRLYIVGIPQGIGGFREPAIPAVVTGARKKRDLLPAWNGRRVVVSWATFRLEDGHLPDYQERGNITRVTAFLAENPWAAAYFVE